jgi:2-amino-4-hydroxy-6-hydroxymethyldihydropteridine diphosphokinase
MARAFVAIGSNIRPMENVRSAIGLLVQNVTVAGLSTVYKTQPENRSEQNPFYNCVVEIRTDRAPRELKYEVLRPIEARLKRRRTSDKNAPRTIDLDLLLYGDRIIKEEGLVLPDADVLRRFYVAAPLAELDPHLVFPGSDMLISALAALLPSAGAEALPAYTDELRQEFRLPE